uniref:EF-hand domain-containing protein n=1 Tax=Cacopsylla melanoneura TaxID=428564 RepID=A0A8D9BAH0_9HEMI
MASDPRKELQMESFLKNEREFVEHQDKYERGTSEVIDRIEEEEEEELERKLSATQGGQRRPSIIDELLDKRDSRKASVISNKSEILKELTKPAMSAKKYSLTDEQVEQFQDVLLNNDIVIQSNDTKMDLVISKDKRNSIDSINSNIEEIERKMSINEEMERKKSISKEYERRKSISMSVNERRNSTASGSDRRSSGASSSSQSDRKSSGASESSDRRNSGASSVSGSGASQSSSERKNSDETRRVSFEMDNVDKNGKRTPLTGKLSTGSDAETASVKSLVDEFNENANASRKSTTKKFQVETGVLTANMDRKHGSVSNLSQQNSSSLENMVDKSPRPSLNETRPNLSETNGVQGTLNPIKKLTHPNNDTSKKFVDIPPPKSPILGSSSTFPKPLTASGSSPVPSKTALVLKPRPISSMEEESLRERARIRLLRQIAEYLESVDGVGAKFNKESFRRVFLNKELLSRLFTVFDQDKDLVLVQEDWIEYLKERLM